MKSNGVGDRAKWVMGGDPHLIGFRHRGDLFCFEKAAAMAKVGLNDVAGPLFEKRPELVPPHQSFAGGNRDGNFFPDFSKASVFSGGTGSSQK